MKETVQPGKYVSIRYVITDDQDQVVEQHDLPIGFVYGSDTELIGGMDQAIQGKSVGDQITVELDPEQTFGAYDPHLTFVDDIDNVPPQFRYIGAEVPMQNESGEVKTFYISKIENGRVTIDGNHPLAGKRLKVKIEILDIRDAQPGEEKSTGIHAAHLQAPGSGRLN